MAISCWLRVLRSISNPLDSGAYRKIWSAPPFSSDRIVAVIDFSGLISFACAFASAAASAPTELLDCCIAVLPFHELECDGSSLRSFGPDPVADRLLRIVGD